MFVMLSFDFWTLSLQAVCPETIVDGLQGAVKSKRAREQSYWILVSTIFVFVSGLVMFACLLMLAFLDCTRVWLCLFIGLAVSLQAVRTETKVNGLLRAIIEMDCGDHVFIPT